jgi:hypothetical protein
VDYGTRTAGSATPPKKQKFFGSFFQKRTPCLITRARHHAARVSTSFSRSERTTAFLKKRSKKLLLLRSGDITGPARLCADPF